MLIIGDVIVTEDVTSEQFACNLDACKGACCWEGDYGAPLEEDELEIMETIYPAVEPYLLPQGKAAIEAQGYFVETPDNGGHATTLINNGACAYMTRNAEGIALCGIEQAWRDGKIPWKKPISCHLYPIRIQSLGPDGFEALNYDRWDICSAACTNGKRKNIRIFEFAKAALVRKYGEDWYDELVAAVAYQEGEHDD